jgi:hypothetical protein
MSIAASSDLLVSTTLLAFLGVLLCRRLVLTGYSLLATIALTTFALAQASIALIGSSAWVPLLFALALYAIGASAASFAQRQDARSVILMGGSLAGVQAIYPVGGFLTVFLVPALVCLVRVRGEPGRSSGLLALLFFAPCVAACVFAYFSKSLHFDGARLLAALAQPRSTFASRSPTSTTLGSACVLVGTAPAIGRILAFRTARTASGLAICAVAAALVVSLAAAPLIGAAVGPRQLSVVVAPLCVLAVCVWPAGQWRNRAAFAAGMFSVLTSWLAVGASLD